MALGPWRLALSFDQKTFRPRQIPFLHELVGDLAIEVGMIGENAEELDDDSKWTHGEGVKKKVFIGNYELGELAAVYKPERLVEYKGWIPIDDKEKVSTLSQQGRKFKRHNGAEWCRAILTCHYDKNVLTGEKPPYRGSGWRRIPFP